MLIGYGLALGVLVIGVLIGGVGVGGVCGVYTTHTGGQRVPG